MKSISFLILLICASCSSQKESQKPRQSLSLNIHSEPQSLDLRKTSDHTSVCLIRMAFEGLLRQDPNGELLPAMAEQIEVSADQTRFVCYLREAKWSDGHPITAHDFVQTWRDILAPISPSPYASDLYIIKNGKSFKQGKCGPEELGVSAPNDRTLIVELDHPVPYFLRMLATYALGVVPSHISLNNPNWADNAGPQFICNGPFRLKEWKHHNRVVFEKNPFYWDAERVKLERIELTMIEDENTDLAMFHNGETEWMGSPFVSIPTEALPYLRKTGQLSTIPISGTYFYIFNTQQFPFTNVKMRRAFALAINRKDIVENVTESGQLPATGLIPPTMWQDERAYFQDGDLTTARRLFQEALDELQLTKEKLPPLKLSYNTMMGHHKIAQAIQEQWQVAFGLRVQLQNKEWKVFLDELNHGDFQIARMGGIASFPDPITFLNEYRYSGGHQFARWHNSEYSALLDKADYCPDNQKRKEFLLAAEQILIDEMPIIPIYYYTGNYLQNPRLKNVHVSEMNDIDFKLSYLEETP